MEGHLNQQLFPSGAVLIPEGGKLNTMFVLRSGELEVVRDNIVVTTIRQPGTIFGEMSVLLDAPHSATVRAVAPCCVWTNSRARRPRSAVSPSSRARAIGRPMHATPRSTPSLSQTPMLNLCPRGG